MVEVFFEVQRGLPRQGPGSNADTVKALALCSELPTNPTVLDIGCGPGMQTLALAEALPGSILAVDICNEYLEELRKRVENTSISNRITIKNANMAALDLSEASFDLIWCEGAAYIMGIPEALKSWRPLLHNQGYLAFTELVWLDDHPVSEVVEFFGSEYPAMTNVAAINSMIRQTGYETIGDFTLSDSAWFDNYYIPLQVKLPALKQKYAGDEEALSVIATPKPKSTCEAIWQFLRISVLCCQKARVILQSIE